MAAAAPQVSRIAWIDIMRGFGILFVVIQHSLIGMLNSKILTHANEGRFVVIFLLMFDMAIIFFVSGFVSRDHKKPWKVFFLNQLIWVIWPYILWSILLVATQKFSHNVNNPIGFPSLLQIWWQPISILWFLYAYFIVKLTDYILTHLIDEHSLNYLIPLILSAIICCAIYEFNIQPDYVNIRQIFFGLFFYLFGRTAAIYRNGLLKIIAFTRRRPLLWLLSIAACFSILIAFAVEYSNTDPATLMPLHDFQRHVLITGIIGVAGILLISDIGQGVKLLSFIRLLGIYSMVIYVQHTMWGAAIRSLIIKADISGDFAFIALIVIGSLLLPLLWQYITDTLKLTRLFGIRPVSKVVQTNA